MAEPCRHTVSLFAKRGLMDVRACEALTPESVRMRCCSFAILAPICFAVWTFYEQEAKHKWRGQLAWRLFQLQQEGEPDSLQQVCGRRCWPGLLSILLATLALILTSRSSLAVLCLICAAARGHVESARLHLAGSTARPLDS